MGGGQEGKHGYRIYFQSIRHDLVSSVYYMAHMVEPAEKFFKIKVLRWLENAILRLAFANTVFH